MLQLFKSPKGKRGGPVAVLAGKNCCGATKWARFCKFWLFKNKVSNAKNSPISMFN